MRIATTSVRAGLAMTVFFARDAVKTRAAGCGQPAARYPSAPFRRREGTPPQLFFVGTGKERMTSVMRSFL